PTVAAANAAGGQIREPSERCHTAARIPPHGSSGVTGASEPNASGTPLARNAANGFSPPARAAPSRCAYMPSGPPQNASNAGCTPAPGEVRDPARPGGAGDPAQVGNPAWIGDPGGAADRERAGSLAAAAARTGKVRYAVRGWHLGVLDPVPGGHQRVQPHLPG